MNILSTLKHIVGINSVSSEGEAAYDSTRKHLIYHDGVQQRVSSVDGYIPYGYPIGQTLGNTTTSAVALAANGGAIAIPVIVEGHVLLEGINFWNTDAATARGDVEFALYEGRTNSSGTLNQIDLAYGALSTWTPSAASLRTVPISFPPIYLAPGCYWLVLKNDHATNTLGIGSTAAGTMALNHAMTKTLTTSALSPTLDLVTGWTKITNLLGVRMYGRVWGATGTWST